MPFLPTIFSIHAYIHTCLIDSKINSLVSSTLRQLTIWLIRQQKQAGPSGAFLGGCDLGFDWGEGVLRHDPQKPSFSEETRGKRAHGGWGGVRIQEKEAKITSCGLKLYNFWKFFFKEWVRPHARTPSLQPTGLENTSTMSLLH